MSSITKNNKLVFQAYDENPNGRTFVIGDVHGCEMDFLDVLDLIEFDKSKDILYSTGDLIDRGQYSREMLTYLKEPWFRSVLGNHEHMLVQSVLYSDYQMARVWYSNGGGWSRHVQPEELLQWAQLIDNTLPYVIRVGTGEKRFYIVHAELCRTNVKALHPNRIPVTEQMIDNWAFSNYDMEDMLWGRRIFGTMGLPRTGRRPRNEDLFQSPELPLIFVGHTPVMTPIRVERQVYIDQGAVYQNTSFESGLTVVEPYADTFLTYNIKTNTVNKGTVSQL